MFSLTLPTVLPLSPLHPTLPIYSRNLVYFLLPEDLCISLLGSTWFLCFFGLWTVGWWSITLCLKFTCEWVHSMFALLGLGYLTSLSLLRLGFHCFKLFSFWKFPLRFTLYQWVFLFMWLWFLFLFSFRAFNYFSLLCTLSVLTTICHVDFLYWPCLIWCFVCFLYFYDCVISWFVYNFFSMILLKIWSI